VIWSAEAVRSEWVQSEADRARGGAKLVQLTVDGAALPMPFDRIQCADMTGWSGEVDAPGWRKVVASVRALLDEGRAALPGARSAAKPTEPLLAVLAFDNLSGDAEMTYFSDGVSEEILQTVARGAELKVIGRGSSFQFRGADKAAAHVASQLKATHVLDGSVRRSGAKVRVAANLIECAGETTLWSDRFDRELSDVFALQDEIAAAVAAALKVAFAPAAKAETVSPTAYNLYLRALEIRNRGLEAGTRLTVVELLDEATALAPKFAGAWAFLATSLAAHLRFDECNHPYAVMRAKVVTAAQTALGLDPNLGAAYQALSELEASAHFEEREALHNKALSVAPNNPTVLTNASLFFTEVGRIREGLGCAVQAYDLDPMYPWAANWCANMLDYAGRFEDARALYAKICAIWPDNALVAWNAILAAAAHRDWETFDALVAAAREQELSEANLRFAISYGRMLREPSPQDQARAATSAKAVLARTGAVPFFRLASLYQYGLKDEVFELTDQASFAFMFDPEQRSPNDSGSNGLIFSVIYGGELMRDHRFPSLCAKLGLCDYWVASQRWPDCAEAGVLPYDFKAECRRLAMV
jgi:adenylate cyclase